MFYVTDTDIHDVMLCLTFEGVRGDTTTTRAAKADRAGKTAGKGTETQITA